MNKAEKLQYMLESSKTMFETLFTKGENMERAEKLLNKIEKLIDENEYNTVKLNGISCSRSDLETLEMILKYFLTHGTYGNYKLIGNIKEVLSKNSLI